MRPDEETQNIHDIIGFWSEIKLQIIREYLPAYSTILSGQKSPTLYHLYVDAFWAYPGFVDRLILGQATTA